LQTTISSPASFSGVGLHSGRMARLVVRPAAADTGIRFRRIDVREDAQIVAARWDAVRPAPLCTRIENDSGVGVSTVEHLMAALAGCGIHNALIEIDGPEVPILDGSAAPFVRAILACGVRRLQAPVRAIRILETVTLREGTALARLEPAEDFEISFRIEFADAAIGAQEKRLNMANGAFVRELCDSRTFCLQRDIAAMRARGLALGGSFENAVVVDGARVLSPGGLRYADEAVRHKMLDALGDLSLAGAPLFGRYVGIRAGHALTNRLLRALFERPGAFEEVECDAAAARRLPGVGIARSDFPAVA